MKTNITQLVTLLLAINGFCVLVDNSLLKRHKEKIYYSFINLFSFLDDTKIPKLHQQLALKITRSIEKLKIWNSQRYGFVIFAITASAVLTIIAYVIGYNLDSSNQQYVEVTRSIYDSGLIAVYFLIAILFNAVFDLASVTITKFHLKKMSTSNYLKFIIIACVDLILALSISIILLNLTFYFSLTLDSYRLNVAANYPHIIDVTAFHLNSIISLLKFDISEVFFLGDIWIPYTYVTYSLTTFIPTIILIIILLTLYLTKVVDVISRGSILLYLERTTEEKIESFKPFTLLGLMLSTTVLVMKVYIEFIK